MSRDEAVNWPKKPTGWLIIEEHSEDGSWSGYATTDEPRGNIYWETKAIPIALQSPPPQQDDREVEKLSIAHMKSYESKGYEVSGLEAESYRSGWQAARAAQSEDVDNLKMIIRRVYRKLKIDRPESAIHLLDEAHDMWRGSPLRDESIKAAEGES